MHVREESIKNCLQDVIIQYVRSCMSRLRWIGHIGWLGATHQEATTQKSEIMWEAKNKWIDRIIKDDACR